MNSRKFPALSAQVSESGFLTIMHQLRPISMCPAPQRGSSSLTGKILHKGCVIRSFGTSNTIKYVLYTKNTYDTIVLSTYLKHFGKADFWPKMGPNRPNVTQTVSNSFPIHCMLLVYYIIAMESRWKAVFGAEVALKRPKIGNCGQILHPYILARFVQFGKIRVKYGTTYYTKTPYDTSLHVCMVLANPIYLSVESSKWQSFAFRL